MHDLALGFPAVQCPHASALHYVSLTAAVSNSGNVPPYGGRGHTTISNARSYVTFLHTVGVVKGPRPFVNIEVPFFRPDPY